VRNNILVATSFASRPAQRLAATQDGVEWRKICAIDEPVKTHALDAVFDTIGRRG
jgi:hypothetical protein